MTEQHEFEITSHRTAIEGVDRTGDGGEAFVDAEGVAAVAAATRADPGSHAGAQYAPTTIASGSGSQPNDDVQAVTGAPPTSFTEFARRTASAWAVGVAK